MPLIELKTNLKSLKYGKDSLGGGDSGQPYIKTDINNPGDNLIGRFDDGLVRGGAVGAAKASAVDTLRISRFLLDAPKGPLFITKQVGLQLSNPKLEHRTNRRTDFSGDNFVTRAGSFVLNQVNRLQNVIGPTRIYNLGVNTLTQIPVNAFGQHIVRHGVLPDIKDEDKYFSVVTFNNKEGNNRLVRLLPILKNENNTIISSYIGGPESVYGIGATVIKRFDKTQTNYSLFGAEDESNARRIITYSDANKRISSFVVLSNITGSTLAPKGIIEKVELPIDLSSPSVLTTIEPRNPQPINYFNTLGVSEKYFVTSQSISVNTKINPAQPTNKPQFVDQSVIKPELSGNPSIKTYGDLITQINDQQQQNQSIISSTKYTNQVEQTNIGDSLVYNNNEVEYKNGYGEIIRLNKSWAETHREKRVGSGRQDQINLTPIFSAPAGTINDRITVSGVPRNINDLVKFRIQSLNGNNPLQARWMVFRAYINSISDDTNANWADIQYAGRGDKMYIYNGFDRKLSISFKVAALSSNEMQPMYQKLNYLMGNLMPDYNDTLMRGPLVRMTIGNWIDGQLCVLNSLSYKVPQDSPWEIGLIVNGGIEPLILPHIVEVNLTFTPIGSQTKGINKIASKSENTSHIAQNINDNQYIR